MSPNEGQKNALLLTGFVGFIALAVIVYFYFMVGKAEIARSQEEGKKVEAANKKLQDKLDEINAIMAQKSKIESMRELIAKVQRRLPSSPDAPGFLQALVDGLATTGIIQEYVQPDKTVDRDLYTEIPYSITAHGYYHSFGQFLTLIEQNPNRFMRVKTMTFGNNVDRPSMHPIDLQLATFMFNTANIDEDEL